MRISARKTACANGHTHASMAEAKRCGDLHLLQRGGVICGLQVEPQLWFEIDGREVKLENGRRAGYRADFAYIEAGTKVIEEVKPARKQARSRDYALRVAIAKALHPTLEFREVTV